MTKRRDYNKIQLEKRPKPKQSTHGTKEEKFTLTENEINTTQISGTEV